MEWWELYWLGSYLTSDTTVAINISCSGSKCLCLTFLSFILFIFFLSSRLSMQWGCLSCRSASGKTLLVFYKVVSVVTSSPVGDSDVLKVTSVIPSSGSVWRSTRLVWHPQAHVRLVQAARRCWAKTPTSCVTMGPKQLGLSSHSNMPGRSVQIYNSIISWIIQIHCILRLKSSLVVSPFVHFCHWVNTGLSQS